MRMRSPFITSTNKLKPANFKLRHSAIELLICFQTKAPDDIMNEQASYTSLEIISHSLELFILILIVYMSGYLP